MMQAPKVGVLHLTLTLIYPASSWTQLFFVSLVLSCTLELPSIMLVVVDAGDPSVVHVQATLPDHQI